MQPSKRLERLPPYLFAELERKVSEKKAAGVDVISLGIGDPDTPTPEPVIAALAAAGADPGTHRYPSNRGRPELRDAFARFYDRRFGVALDPETEIIPALGAKECVFNLNLAFLDPDSIALAADPGYPVYTGGPLLAGAEAVLMPLLPERGFAPDLDAISGGRGRASAAALPQLPEQPDRRRGARRPVRARRRVRARARRPDRARRLLHGDDLRRLRRPVVPGDPGREGGRRGGLLALEGLEHDRLAHRRPDRERRRRQRLLAPEDQHRLGHVRGGSARRRRRARRRAARGDAGDLPAPPRPRLRRARRDRRRGDPAEGDDLRLGAGAARASRRPPTASWCSRSRGWWSPRGAPTAPTARASSGSR